MPLVIREKYVDAMYSCPPSGDNKNCGYQLDDSAVTFCNEPRPSMTITAGLAIPCSKSTPMRYARCTSLSGGSATVTSCADSSAPAAEMLISSRGVADPKSNRPLRQRGSVPCI